jgi:serine/threonine-protein kinase RsbW
MTGDGCWEHRATAHAANVGLMRTGLVEFAAQHGAGRSVQADIALVVSEGLTNAVMHAFVKQAVGTMSVIAVATADVLQVSIVDDGSGMSPREDSPGLGWGLKVIAGLTSSLEVDNGPAGRGTELHLTLNAPGLRANGAALHLTQDRAL